MCNEYEYSRNKSKLVYKRKNDKSEKNTYNIKIATGEINGLNKEPYYHNDLCAYFWDITFSNTSCFLFNNIPFIKVGNTEEESISFCNKLKKVFKEANIHDGERVAIIFKNSGKVIAIGKLGLNLWIDVRNNFALKTFKELKINIRSLRLY